MNNPVICESSYSEVSCDCLIAVNRSNIESSIR